MTTKKTKKFIVEEPDFTPVKAKPRGVKSKYVELAEVALENPGRWVRMTAPVHETSVSDGRRKAQALNPNISTVTQPAPTGSKPNYKTVLMRFDPNLDDYSVGDVI